MGKLSFQPWLCFSRCALPSQFRNLTPSGLKILPVNPAFVSDGLPVPNGNLINALIRSTSSQKKKNRFSKRTRSKMRKWVRVVVSISGKGRYYVQFWPITLLVWKPMVSLDVIVTLNSVPWDTVEISRSHEMICLALIYWSTTYLCIDPNQTPYWYFMLKFFFRDRPFESVGFKVMQLTEMICLA